MEAYSFNQYQKIFENKKANKKEVVIMFTDVVGSSDLWKNDDKEMMLAIDEHFKRINKIVNKNGGDVLKGIGDAFMCEFKDMLSAVKAAQGLLTDLRDNPIKIKKKDLNIRIGISMGDAYLAKHNIQGVSLKDYYGNVINTASRMEGEVAEDGGFAFSYTKDVNIDDVEEYLEDVCDVSIIDYVERGDQKIRRSTRLLTDYHMYFVRSLDKLKGIKPVRVYKCNLK